MRREERRIGGVRLRRADGWVNKWYKLYLLKTGEDIPGLHSTLETFLRSEELCV